MEYISSYELSKKWGISQRRITLLAKEGKIPGAMKVANNWLIPNTAEKPLDARYSDNKKINEAKTQFIFPIFIYSVDHNEEILSTLSKDQRRVLRAEKEFYANRMNNSFPLFLDLLKHSKDIFVKMSCLYHLSFTTLLQNNFSEFEKYYGDLKFCVNKYQVKYPTVKYLLQDMELIMKGNVTFGQTQELNNSIFDKSSFPFLIVKEFYNNAKNSFVYRGNKDFSIYESLLMTYEKNGFYFVSQNMHIYLAISYIQNRGFNPAKDHLRKAIKIAQEYDIYAPICQHYHYFTEYLDEVVQEFPNEIKTKIVEGNNLLINAVNGVSKHYSNSKIEELSVIDIQYIAYAIRDITIKEIAYELDITEPKVNAKYLDLCHKFKVKNREDLANKLKNCLINQFMISEKNNK